MTVTEGVVTKTELATRARHQIGGLAFDWASFGSSLLLIGGLLIDGWSHFHGRTDQSFFTPWHALLYLGFLATGVVHVGAISLNRWRGYSLEVAIPRGYKLSLIGVFVFAFGGVIDMIWHSFFGIEVNLEAIFSPSHFALVLGAVLMFGGPLRAAWYRYRAGSQLNVWQATPAIFSLLLSATIIGMYTFYVSPFGGTWASAKFTGLGATPYLEFSIALGVTSILVSSGLLMGLLFTVGRRWTLPFGAWTVFLTLYVLFVTILTDESRLIWAAALTGLFIDGVTHFWPLHTVSRFTLRVFGFVTPVFLFSFYFLALELTGGVGWSVHVWTGAIFLAGLMGLLVSYLFVPAIEQV